MHVELRRDSLLMIWLRVKMRITTARSVSMRANGANTEKREKLPNRN
jgi:hypothetical protein